MQCLALTRKVQVIEILLGIALQTKGREKQKEVEILLTPALQTKGREQQKKKEVCQMGCLKGLHSRRQIQKQKKMQG